MKLRKITALITSVFMAVTAFSASAFAENTSKKSTSFENIEISSATANVYESNLVMNLNSADSKKVVDEPQRGTFNASDSFCHADTLTSEDAVDFYLFSVIGEKTLVFTLESTNEDYIAIVCPIDSEGHITVSGPYAAAGYTTAIGDFNSDSQNNYCVVVLNQGSTYGNTYTIALNAKNPGGATSIVNASPDYSYMVCGYPNNVYMINGVNIKTTVTSYISQNVPAIDIDQIYYRLYFPNSSASAYHKCYVWVKSSQAYLSTSAMEYGVYVTGNTTYYHAVKIPIIGGQYYCYRSTSVNGTTYDGGTPNGYMVYDLESGTIVDWASGLNFFHTTYYNEAFSFSSAAYLL